MAVKRSDITSFDFHPGRVLARKYEVIKRLGAGWEGEVFLVKEQATDIERAAKFYYPARNPNNKNLLFYAKKLHKLRQCSILIQYQTQETITYKNEPVSFMVSDFVEGEILDDFLLKQPGKRLDLYQALQLLHALAEGIEHIHHMREYHGDLHTGNIIIRRHGISFEIKLLDLFHWGKCTSENIHDDVVNLIRIFYDALGGQKFYKKLSPIAKGIICGLKRSLILKKFRSAGQLRDYLETMQWPE